MATMAPSPFVFVGQGNRGDRRFINSHIRRAALEKQRRSKLEVGTVLVVPQTPRRETTRKPPRSRTVTACEDCDQLHLSKRSKDQPVEELIVEVNVDSQFEPPNPVTILDDPYIDPFKSTLIPFDRDSRAALTFNIEVFQPWAEGIQHGGDLDGSFANKFFHRPSEALNDRTSGYALLARLSSISATITSDSHMHAASLKYKNEAYKNLRKALNTAAINQNPDFLVQMFSLLSMEVAGHNHSAASMHADALGRLIQSSYQDTNPCTKSEYTLSITSSATLLCAILWHDAMRTFHSLARPSLHPALFPTFPSLQGTLFTIRTAAMAQGVWPLPPTHCGFAAAGLSPKALTDLHTVRFCASILSALSLRPELADAATFGVAFTYQAASMEGELMECYNDAIEALATVDEQAVRMRLRLEAAVCLCARFWIRCLSNHEGGNAERGAFGKVAAVYSAGAVVLNAVKEFVEAEEMGDWGPVEAALEPRRAWLWVFYVCALAERVREGEGFFEKRFSETANSLGLRSWVTVKWWLEKFLYKESMVLPYGTASA